MSQQSDTLGTLSEHPASPVLLTRSGPLGIQIPDPKTVKPMGYRAHLKFENRSRKRDPRFL